MILLRSLAFAALFYLWSVLIVLLMLATIAGPPAWVLAWARLWNRGTMLGLRLVCGVRVEVRGAERIPRGAALVAAKHQCMFDTFAPISQLSHPAFVAKAELTAIPLFGWYGVRGGLMLVIDRAGGAGALRGLLAEGRRRLAEGQQLVIFPEGTRTAPGAPAAYKPGVAGLYRELGVACTPMATNAGVHWPAHGLLRYPGTIVFEYLEPIPPGLKRGDFMRLLEQRIESATSALIAEGI